MSSVNVSIDDNIPMSREYRKKAYEYEKADELQLALFHLKIAESLDSKNVEIKKEVAALKEKIETESQRHFTTGLEEYQNERFEEARLEFLTALRYNPHHDDALYYLKEEMSPEIFSRYVVGEGETFESITEKFYGDKNKSFMIAELNDYKDVDTLKKGDELRVPILAVYPGTKKTGNKISKKQAVVKKARVRIKKSGIESEKAGITGPQVKLIKEGKRLFREGKFEEVVSVADEILKKNPSNREAKELKNASYFNMGKLYHEQGEYFKALRFYGNVDQDYEGVQDEIDSVKMNMKEAAQVHYERGVEYFKKDELRKAILEWARALTYDPEHKEARMDMERARSILKESEGKL
jgi:tetratricopeptide (TPR) repeat protein